MKEVIPPELLKIDNRERAVANATALFNLLILKELFPQF